jgi:hypothetical protein
MRLIIEKAQEEGLEGWSFTSLVDWKCKVFQAEEAWSKLAHRIFPDHINLYKMQFEARHSLAENQLIEASSPG